MELGGGSGWSGVGASGNGRELGGARAAHFHWGREENWAVGRQRDRRGRKREESWVELGGAGL